MAHDFRELAAAILAGAVLDLGRGSRKAKMEARRFLQSSDAAFWCEVAGHDPDNLAGLDLDELAKNVKQRKDEDLTLLHCQAEHDINI